MPAETRLPLPSKVSKVPLYNLTIISSHTLKDKDKWINAERIRWSKYFNIPISQDAPPGFPLNTLPIQRTLCSLSLSHPQSLPQAISLFWENFWVHFNDPMKPENLHAIVRTAVGSDEEAKKVIERTKTDEVKKLLSANTQQAFKDGAFGLPWSVGEFMYASCGRREI
jgi:2-hydroxychromene-2-carboxylate isomerase